MIESIKNLFRKIGESIDSPGLDARKQRFYLRRGTMEKIKALDSAYYEGEIILCTDEPFFGIGTYNGYLLVPIPEECRPSLIRHYNQSEHVEPDLTWE